MPFILRGVSQLGCNSADAPNPLHTDLWAHPADDWRPANLDALLSETVRLEGLPNIFERMLDSRTLGRILVELCAEARLTKFNPMSRLDPLAVSI
ncbi:MAG: hypothetical protein MZV65_12305 [Chromatiales bacterium]|nr:hypothetical protein [Chromatiales bacterium]